MSFFVSSLRKAVNRKRNDPTPVLEKRAKDPQLEVSTPTRTRRPLDAPPTLKDKTFARTTVDKFQMSKKLGEGTFAIVMSARCKTTGKKSAVKMLKKERDLDFLQPGANYSEGVTYKDVIDIFQAEVKCMESLGSHPNIVSTWGKGDHFIVMESAKVDLYTIRHAAGTGLPLKMAKSWTQQILTAVNYVHHMGYVHQDIKSSNILIFEDRTAKLCDFGLARKAEETMPVDRELLTLWYRAPELLMGSRTYTRKVDEWSIGCIVLEMLLGHVPFQGHHECTCSCSSVSHVNYNSDQLQKIFKIVGTPTEAEDLRGMACVKHFVDWRHIESRLQSTVEEALVASESRMKTSLALSDLEYQQQSKDWVELLKSLLVLNPARRATCQQTLQLPFFSRGEAAAPSSPPSPSSVSKSPLRSIVSAPSESPKHGERRRSQLSADNTPPSVSAGSTQLPAFSRTESAEVLSRASSAQSDAAEERAQTKPPPSQRSFKFKSMSTNSHGQRPDLSLGQLNSDLS